jgi:hypothetical protein
MLGSRQQMCLLNFALGTLLAACSSDGTGNSINGNWYAMAPSFTPDPAYPISGVGFALVEKNGSLSGNLTTYLVATQVPCDSLSLTFRLLELSIKEIISTWRRPTA